MKVSSTKLEKTSVNDRITGAENIGARGIEPLVFAEIKCGIDDIEP
jgi:hypothetical protein